MTIFGKEEVHVEKGKVIAIANQKGGVGYGKLYIM